MPNYVSNKELLRLLAEDKVSEGPSRKLLDIYYLMAESYSYKFAFKNEDDRKDCVQTAVIDCYQYSKGFKPEKSSNAFSYITQIIKNGFRKFWKTNQQLNGMMKISLDGGNIYSL
jgi:DNA-directed RNA polymerase specialized sigma24 family protein